MPVITPSANARRQQQEGFALFIIAGMFIAFAMLSSAMIDRTNATQQLDLNAETQIKLKNLSQALVEYSLDHGGRYPCPADETLPSTDSDFGKAVTGCEATGGTVHGMVPIVTLVNSGAGSFDPSKDTFDAWGNRIMYYVDSAITPSGSGTPSVGQRVIVRDLVAEPNRQYRESDFLVISYGRDGIGGIPQRATSVAIACNQNGEVRFENCDGTDLFFFIQPIMTGPSVTSAEYFDDLLSFYGK
jgi:hypothetical protein